MTFYWGSITWINGKIFSELSTFSEWTVTRVIISRSPAASSTDRASHHTEFEEEHKCKGKGCY